MPYSQEEEKNINNFIIQAEFSHLNTNYLYVMVTVKGNQLFKVIDLTSAGLQTEIEFELVQKAIKSNTGIINNNK